jgi:cytochrome d ubiquinol oxidase subunit II
MHGCAWAANKTGAAVAARARALGSRLALLFIGLMIVSGAWTIFGVPAYHFVSPLIVDGPSNPLLKIVAHDGNWLDNFRAWPWLWLAPILAYGGALGVFANLRRARDRTAFACSALAIAGTILTAGFALFPFLLPSSANPNASLTVWDASSSLMTLRLMLFAAVVFLPLIGLYTLWVYRVLRGRTEPGPAHAGISTY